MKLTAICRQHLTEWRLQLITEECSPATIDLFVRVLRGAFAWIVQSGRLFLNPAEGLVAPKVHRLPRIVPSEDAMRRLLEHSSMRGSAIGLRDLALLETMYASGARLEETVKLDVKSADFANAVLRLRGKGGKDRVVPLTRSAVGALHDYLCRARPVLIRGRDSEAALFLSQRGGRRLAHFAVAGIVHRRSQSVGLALTPHAIRRAFATHLSRAGARLTEIRELLGHRGCRHLNHYLQFHPDEMVAKVKQARPCRR